MHYIFTQKFVGLIVIGFVLLSAAFLAAPKDTFAQSPADTVFLELSKIVSPAHFGGTLAASDFFFTVTENGVNQMVNHGGTIELEVGTYSITEGYSGSDSIGFNPADWTALWAGDICVGANIPATQAGTLEVLSSDIGKFVVNNPGKCNAENQFKPGSVQVTKTVVGTSTNPDAFSFTINNGSPISFESDGSNDVDIPAGNYEITEVTASGYTTTYSAGCTGVVANNENVSCTITNTWITTNTPVLGCTDSAANNYNSLATQDDGSCTYDNVAGTGVLQVIKTVINDNSGTSSYADFSFSVNGGTAITFEVDGTNRVTLATGTYSVVESAVSGYTTTYNNCTDVVVAENATSTCTITNNDTSGGGTNGGDDDTYRIEGYVWHDDNENTQWDGFNEEVLLENEQSGWVVKITNGSKTYSTTTDPTGFYYFEVPAGTWTITEVLQDGWTLITPSAGNFEVTVPDVSTLTMMDTIRNFLIPTAHAAVLGTYGPFNFGNNESPTTPGGGGGGGGGSSSPRCNLFEATRIAGDTVLTWETRYGNELAITSGGVLVHTTDDNSDVREGTFTSSNDSNAFTLTVTRGSREDVCTAAFDQPTPQVLGEQVDIIPQGAPDAGSGGTSPISALFGSIAPVALLGRKQIQNV